MIYPYPTKILFSVIALFVGYLNLQGQLETFTNDAGISIQAELLEFDDLSKVVTLRSGNGSTMKADLKAFSFKDQKRIEAWWETVQAEKQVLHANDRLELFVRLNRQAKEKGRYHGYYNIDDKVKAFYPEISIENSELQTFTGNEVRLVILADDLQNKGQILVVSASTIETDLYQRGLESLEGEPFRLRSYEYNSSHSTNYDFKYGYEYKGYIVIIKNSRGEITHSRATREHWLRQLKHIYNCKAGELYYEDFDHKLRKKANSYFVR